MKIHVKANVLISALLVFSGCTSVSVEANKEVEYDHFLEKVAIIVNTGNITMGVFGEIRLSDLLSKSIYERFTLARIDSRIINIRGLALNEEQIRRETAEYAPRQVLALQPKDGFSVWNQNLRNCVFDVVLYDTESSQNVWRGQLVLRQIQTEWGVFLFTVDQMVDAITDALREDSLLR